MAVILTLGSLSLAMTLALICQVGFGLAWLSLPLQAAVLLLMLVGTAVVASLHWLESRRVGAQYAQEILRILERINLGEIDHSLRLRETGDIYLNNAYTAFNRLLEQYQSHNSGLEREKHLLDTQRELAEHASDAKSEFLALMSHELRTPMAGVIGMLDLGLREPMTPSLRDKVTLALNNAKGLLSIVNDLLDFSKIEAGKLHLESLDFELRSMMDDAMSLLHESARQKSIEFALNIDTKVFPFIKGDPTRLRQVIINLVGNALKFTEQGGVTIHVKRLNEAPVGFDLSVGADQQWVRFAVRDSGIGLSKEAQGRMFTKFEQADASTTRRFGGTGLGLAICKQLVELMGGQIGVTSREGYGSVFYFDVPLLLGEKPQEVGRYVVGPHDHVLNILVAEDAHTNKVIIQALLDEMGHRCHIVDNGQLALDAMVQQQYDLILMDGRMPVLDGVKATALIRTGYEFDKHWFFSDTSIPIIALTANAGDVDREKFISAGVNSILTKPVDDAALHMALSRVIEGHLQAGRALPRRLTPTQSPSAADPLAGLDALMGVSPAATVQPTKPAVSKSTKPDLRQKLIPVFLDQAPKRVQEIERAIECGDWSTVAIVVHGIKGSMAYIWPDNVGVALGARLEVLADQGQGPGQEFGEGFVQLKQAIQEALQSEGITLAYA